MSYNYEDAMKVGAGIWLLSLAGILVADFIPDQFKLPAMGVVTLAELVLFLPIVCMGDDDEYEPSH